jgi:hypothetical protein
MAAAPSGDAYPDADLARLQQPLRVDGAHQHKAAARCALRCAAAPGRCLRLAWQRDACALCEVPAGLLVQGQQGRAPEGLLAQPEPRGSRQSPQHLQRLPAQLLLQLLQRRLLLCEHGSQGGLVAGQQLEEHLRPRRQRQGCAESGKARWALQRARSWQTQKQVCSAGGSLINARTCCGTCLSLSRVMSWRLRKAGSGRAQLTMASVQQLLGNLHMLGRT